MPRARLSLCTGKRQAIGATWGKSTLGRQWRELRREHAPLLDLRWDLALPLSLEGVVAWSPISQL